MKSLTYRNNFSIHEQEIILPGRKWVHIKRKFLQIAYHQQQFSLIPQVYARIIFSLMETKFTRVYPEHFLIVEFVL
jgi:hypothetical protein